MTHESKYWQNLFKAPIVQTYADKFKIHDELPSEIKVDFEQNGKGLESYIYTPRLLIYSCGNTDLENLVKLFGDADNMRQYNVGKPFTRAKVTEMYNEAIKQWSESYPYSIFIIADQEKGNFIGYIILKKGSAKEGKVELAYIIDKKYCGQKIATEAALAMTYFFAPECKNNKYNPDKNSELTAIDVTVRTDNIPSERVIQKLMFKKEKSIEKFGAIRNQYALSLEKINQSRGNSLS